MKFWWTSPPLSAARNAARAGDWRTAAAQYEIFLANHPRHAAAWVQLGHARKALSQIEPAIAAYDRAIALAPAVADTFLQKAGALRRNGQRAEAIECCVRALEIDPGFALATEELLSLGARDRLPGGVSHASAEQLAAMPWIAATADQQRGDVYAPSHYADYRRALKIPAAPASQEKRSELIAVLINARNAIPADVRATLSSLLDQVDAAWHATVFAPLAVRDHSVASLAAIDPRIRFVPDDAPLLPVSGGGLAMLLDAGTMVDRQGVGWFRHGFVGTGCIAAYCDHDAAVDDWRTGRRHDSPMFQPDYDPIWFADRTTTPAIVVVDTRKTSLPERCADDTIATALAAAGETGGVAHIPLLLATVRRMAPQAASGLPDGGASPAASLRAVAPQPAPDPRLPLRIQVIVQTRDQPAMLRKAIASLRRKAAHADLLDFTIVDNRSRETETAALFQAMHRDGQADILQHDETFNWSRANNLAAAQGTAPILLFANNDIEMLSNNWDTALRRAIALPGAGAVGALLLYPDRTIQHGGMIMGMGNGGPVHEALGLAATEPGAMGRQTRERSAAAVTGAFLGITRSLFDELGGFDATGLAIAFNDVDLCFKVRRAGLLVVQTPHIQLIHYESKSRGINTTRSQVAWDLDELGTLYRRWGDGLFDDPGYNPHWTRIGQPFDGYRFPTTLEIANHINRSARPKPWSIMLRDEAGRPADR